MTTVLTTTILFTDLVDSTGLLARLGHDGYEAFRQRHFALVRRAIGDNGGHEVKNIGDGFMATFASAAAAVDCSVAIQQANWHEPEAPGVRIGISLGEVTEDGGDYFGQPVVEAARLCARAEGGQILAADIVRALAAGRGRHEFRSVGALALKGLPEPVAACEVVWSPPAADAERHSHLPLSPALSAVARTTFVGREAALARLTAVFERASTGTRQLALIAGEPGVGKTRLAAELCLKAHASGANVLYGRCDEEALMPYQPFVEAIRAYWAAAPVDVRDATLGPEAGGLARIVPEIGTGAPAGEGDRDLVFSAVGRALAAIAADTPLILVLDDLHWADRTTLLLLKSLAREASPAKLTVVGTYRETDLARTHPLTAILADLRREVAPERLLLRGLDEAEVGSLLQSLAPHEPSREAAALAATLHRETEGNAFFLHEVVRHLKETGTLLEHDGLWRTNEASLVRGGIPEGVKEVVGRRLSRLSEACNQALTRAAVLGRDFTVAPLERLPGGGGDALLDSLDEAVAAGLIEETEGLPGGYRFTHALVRETLYGELSTTRRVRLHGQAAEALESTYGARAIEHAAELAYHYGEGAAALGIEKLVPYARAAGEQAARQHAYDEAAGHFEAAVGALENDGVTPTPDLLFDLGRAQTAAFRRNEAWRSLNRAFDGFAAAGDVQGLVWAAEWLGRVDFVGASYTSGAPALLDRALGLVSADSREACRLNIALGYPVGLNPGHLERARRAFAEAADWLARNPDARLEIRLLTQRAVTEDFYLTTADTLADYERAIAIAESLGAGDATMMAHFMATAAAERRGDLQGARYHAGRTAEIAARARQAYMVVSACWNSLLLEYITGDWVAMQEALEQGARADPNDPRILAGAALLAIETGDEAAIPAALARLHPREWPWAVGVAVAAGLARPDLDRVSESERAIADATPFYRVYGHNGLALIAYATGDRLWAERLREDLEPYLGDLTGFRLTDHVCGLLCWTLGDMDRAITEIEAAVAWDERGFHMAAAWAAYDCARARLARGAPGDAGRAAELLAMAQATASRLGMPPLLRLVRELAAGTTRGAHPRG